MREKRRKLRVLAVDDDYSMRLLLAAVLTRARCRVLTASNGAEAVKVMESKPVDLLITDYDMPRMNGLELIRWSKVRFPHMRVVMITGNASQALAPGEEACGALHILPKPFSVEHLLSLVEDLRAAVPIP